MEFIAYLQKKNGYQVHIFNDRDHFESWSSMNRGLGGRFVTNAAQLHGRRLPGEYDHRTIEFVF